MGEGVWELIWGYPRSLDVPITCTLRFHFFADTAVRGYDPSHLSIV
jgi:hypothetical protein